MSQYAEIRGFAIHSLRSEVAEVTGVEGTCLRLLLTAVVSERGTGRRIEIQRGRTLSHPSDADAEMLRAEVLALLLHELEESIYVGDERVYDPHRGEQP